MASQGGNRKVVVVSAKTSERDVVRAFGLGAAAYVHKPFDPHDLVDTIRFVANASPDQLETQRVVTMSRVGHTSAAS